jgi:hypothetical protein
MGYMCLSHTTRSDETCFRRDARKKDKKRGERYPAVGAATITPMELLTSIMAVTYLTEGHS